MNCWGPPGCCFVSPYTQKPGSMEQTEALIRDVGALQPQEWLDPQVRTLRYLLMTFPLHKASFLPTVASPSPTATPLFLLRPRTSRLKVPLYLSQFPHPQGLPSLSRSGPWGDLSDQPTALQSCPGLPHLDDPHVSLSCLGVPRSSLHGHPDSCFWKASSSFWTLALLQSPRPPDLNGPHPLERTLGG